MSQLTVDVEVPVTLAANGCVRPTGTDWGDAEVPVGVTVTPTGVELLPQGTGNPTQNKEDAKFLDDAVRELLVG